MFTTIALWSVPLVIIPLSLLANRFLPFRKVRYSLYGLILIGAFVLNLFLLSFHDGIADTALYLLANFAAMELFWHLTRVKFRTIRIALYVIGLTVFGALHFRWIIAGPGAGWKLWKPPVVSTFSGSEYDYCIKERDCFNYRHPARIFTLARHYKKFPLEREVKTFRTPEGFYQTNFSFKWSTTNQGVRVDFFADNMQLWTMGEGF